jgi:GAF domain-containing protein
VVAVPLDERGVGPEVVLRVDEVTDALAGLAGVLNEEAELGRVLQSVVDQAVRVIPGSDMVSISVLPADSSQAVTQTQTLASSSDRVVEIDAQQYAAGNGPCLEAARTGRIVRVDMEQALRRWPRFARDAQRAGVASYLSAPLSIDKRFAGSLNLYGEQVDSFGSIDEALVRLYTMAAAEAIANARRYAQARAEADNLRRALDSRAVIDQAIGVLMVQRGIGPQQAFDELSRTSQNTNTKLRDVAAQIIDRARRRIV